MISTKLEQADKKHLEKGFELGEHCLNKGIDFFVLTSSGSDEINKYSQTLTICTADETTLKTIVRSNPGYLLLRNGVIAGKWSWATIPSKTEFTEDLNKQKVDSMNNKRNILIVYSSALSALVLFLLISSIFSKRKGIS
jgi:triosephosphate isomerase